jgi:hypothetical protein
VWSLAMLKVIIHMGFFHDATLCSFFLRPLHQLEVVTVCNLCVEFKCQSFFGSDFEVINGHGVEKKEVNEMQESKNYSGGGKESNCVAKLNCEAFWTPSVVIK